MYRNLSSKFGNGTVMLLRMNDQKEVEFVGTGFLCHSSGYVLSCAHNISIGEKVVMAPSDPINTWSRITKTSVQTFPMKIVQYDPTNDVALLKIEGSLSAQVPTGIWGSAENCLAGSSVIYFGYPFADTGLHVLKMSASIISSKVITEQGTKRIQLDSMVHNGTSGGPVIDVSTSKIIGIISGKQSPTGGNHGGIMIGNYALGQESSISYATAIEYGIALMKQEKISVQ